MHKLLSLWVASWGRMLSYRGDIMLWSASEAITPLLSLALWYAVAQSGTGPLTPQETITYYVLVVFTLSMTDVWNGFFLIQEILDGKIIQFLTKPIGFFWFYLFRNLTPKIVRLVPQAIIFTTLFILFGDYILPTIFEARNLLLFALSLVGGLAVSFTLDMVFAMLAFWIEDATQIREYKEVLHTVASGLFIPFAFMPAFAQTMFHWLPFRSIIATPVEIALGQATGAQVWQLLGIQLAWVVVLLVGLKILWRQGLKTYAVPGQ